MKKKTGFTLAEILVSLGIIGVIAAVTMPSLTTNTQNAQIGPKLAKAVASFEQGTSNLLSSKGVEKISDLDESGGSFLTSLSDHLKINNLSDFKSGSGRGSSCISSFGNTITSYFQSADGVAYCIRDFYDATTSTKPPHKQLKGYMHIDINSLNNPNVFGEDIFLFALYEDGSLRPVGGVNWNENEENECRWTSVCAKDSSPTDPAACAGHIFENNFKKLYK